MLKKLNSTAPNKASSVSPGLPAPWKQIQFILLITAFLFWVFRLYQSYENALDMPYGSWDARAIWNLKARFLHASDDRWINMFDKGISYSHPDYPLLLSGSIASIWDFIGRADDRVPRLISLLFSYSTPLCLFLFTANTKNRLLAVLAMLLLLTSETFMGQAHHQLADIPLSFFFLCACYLFNVSKKDKRYHSFMLFGLLGGLAAWTKNEGLLMYACFIFVILLPGIIRFKPMEAAKQTGSFILGSLPALGAIIMVKRRSAVSNDLVNESIFDRFSAQFFEIDRLKLILHHLSDQFSGIWKDGWLPLIIICTSVLLLGIDRDHVKRFALPLLLTVFLVCFGYITIYMLSPLELEWHLNTSLKRLMVQLLPGFIFIFVISLKDCTECIRR
jgi:hypothetical protein